MTTRTVNYSAGERLIQRIPLDRIQMTHNPRTPCPALMAALPQEFPEAKRLIDLVHMLALSEDSAMRNRYRELMDKYESTSTSIDDPPLVELAHSRAKMEQQAIILRSYRKGGTGDYYYGIVSGERRYLAQAYNYVLHGDLKYRTIGADVRCLTLDEAGDLAFDENHQRKQMTALEIGEWLVRRVAECKNKTGEAYTLRELANDRKMDYQFCRSREALTYLPDNLKDKLRMNKLGVTEAAKIGREIKQNKRHKDGTPKEGQEGVRGRQEHRAHMLSLKFALEEFDNIREKASEEFLKGMLHCMRDERGNIPTLAAALKASDQRKAM